jgi:hypothetical protein
MVVSLGAKRLGQDGPHEMARFYGTVWRLC